MADRTSTASAHISDGDSSSRPGASGSAGSASVSSPGSSGPASVGGGEQPDPLLGRLISGRFKIVSVIARGGMGKVYRAEQAPLGRVCALKVLSPKYQGDRDPEFSRRFFLEAATAAKLTHPNTVTVFDYGQDGEDVYFIAMEYIEGKTLHRVLRESGPMHEDRVARICSQICRSLREAHALGVVHRDLKPGNIMIADRGDEQDVVKVLDFGLVKDLTHEGEDLTQAGLFMGSPKYMAPEQILGGDISAATDIYSLGVMMFEMLVGRVPFDRGVSVKTLMAHVNDPLPAMREVNPGIRAGAMMENIVLRCLEKEANHRFASMKDLLLALKRVGNEDALITETTELARSYVGASGSIPPSIPPSPSGSGPIPPESTMPPSSASSASAIVPGGHTPSISETLGSVPATLTETPGPSQGRGRMPLLVGVIAALSVVGIGAVIATGSSDGGVKPGATSAPTVSVSPQTPQTNPQPGTGTASATAAPAVATGMANVPLVRQVRVESDPPGASVSEGDTQLCTSTPCELTWKGDAARGEHKLQLSKKGFKNTKLTVSASDESASVKLEASPAYVPPPPVTPPTPPIGSGRPLYKKDI